MNYSCEDAVKPGKIFREEYLGLINAIEMYRYHLDEGQTISCSLCEYGAVILELTNHIRAAKR